MSSPTQLSLEWLRSNGWTVDVAERWVGGARPGSGTRRDLFGLIDLVAVRGGATLGVQTTSASNVSAHVRKITDEEHADRLTALHDAGWRIVVHGWCQITPAGTVCKGTRCLFRSGRSSHQCRWTLHRNIEIPLR